MSLNDKVLSDFKKGMTRRKIAEKYDLTYGTVCRVIKRNKISNNSESSNSN